MRQNSSMLVYINFILHFFIRETTLISNPCLFNQYKYGNECKGNFTLKDFYESNKSWTTVYSVSQFHLKNEVLISMAFCIDNDVLKFLDCPAGYFGNGCTEKCVLPSFGRACSDTCNCSFCHHVFGCILSSEFKGIIKLIYNIYKKITIMCYTAFTCRLCMYCSSSTQFVDHYTVLLF